MKIAIEPIETGQDGFAAASHYRGFLLHHQPHGLFISIFDGRVSMHCRGCGGALVPMPFSPQPRLAVAIELDPVIVMAEV